MKKFLTAVVSIVFFLAFILFTKPAYALIPASTDPSPIQENTALANITIPIPPDEVLNTNWKVQVKCSRLGRGPDKTLASVVDADGDGTDDAIRFIIRNNTSINGNCEFDKGTIGIDIFREVGGKDELYNTSEYTVGSKGSSGSLSVNVPSQIIRGRPFDIQYSGAKNRGCYGITLDPPEPVKQSIVYDPTCRISSVGRIPSSGTITIDAINNPGNYTLKITGYNSIHDDFALIPLTVINPPANSTDPDISLKICVYPQGTAPGSGGCSSSGESTDMFVASGQAKNVPDPENTAITLWYTQDFKTYDVLASFTPDASGSFNEDISNQVQNEIKNKSATGTISTHASISVAGNEYNSRTTTFSITNLALTPTIEPTKPPVPTPPCPENQQVEVKSKDESKTYGKTCQSVPTGIGNIMTDFPRFIKTVFGALLGISGGIALFLIMISGYRLIMSGGNPEKIQGARETITSAIVGLLFIIFSLVILQVIGVDILKIPGFGNVSDPATYNCKARGDC